MKKRTIIFFTIVLILSGICCTAYGSHHGEELEMKKGILLVAFGTSVPEAQAVFKNVENSVKSAYPGIEVRWAYTSSIIRKKLAVEGQFLDSPEVALARMMEDGFTHVAVQSLHTILGEEFHDLQRNAFAFKDMAGGIQKIILGYPLLAKEEDIVKVVDGMMKHIPRERKGQDAVVFMGHGTPHPANAFYAALMYHFQQKDPNIFVGTVEGSPGIEEIRDILVGKKIKKAYLLPFMSVAGDHAMNDMAGNEDDSWKSILTKSGIKCVTVLKGTAAYPEIVKIWVDHLGTALAHFK